jgi:diguanylate cyclase (GGDEF)-like protein
VKSYTEKYDLVNDSELLSSIRRMQDRLRSDLSEGAVLSALVDEIARLARWDALNVTMFAEDRRNWVVQRVVNRSERPCVPEGTAVDLHGSIVGEVILSNRVEVVPDLAAEDRPRFAPAEQLPREGTFVSIPVSSFSRCYGAVSLESGSTSAFSGSDVEMLYRLVENASAVLEVVYMNTMVREYASLDHLTGLTTRKFYLRQVEEEVLRAEDFGSELACITLSVDVLEDHVQRYGHGTAELVLHDIAGIVRAHARPYDVAGHEGTGRIGILLVNRTASDAYLWMEKVRKAVAGHVLSRDGRTFSVTVSAGICGLTQGMSAAELLDGSAQVLSRAVESGGNVVRVY